MMRNLGCIIGTQMRFMFAKQVGQHSRRLLALSWYDLVSGFVDWWGWRHGGGRDLALGWVDSDPIRGSARELLALLQDFGDYDLVGGCCGEWGTGCPCPTTFCVRAGIPSRLVPTPPRPAPTAVRHAREPVPLVPQSRFPQTF